MSLSATGQARFPQHRPFRFGQQSTTGGEAVDCLFLDPQPRARSVSPATCIAGSSMLFSSRSSDARTAAM
jgi:hypothetical protein